MSIDCMEIILVLAQQVFDRKLELCLSSCRVISSTADYLENMILVITKVAWYRILSHANLDCLQSCHCDLLCLSHELSVQVDTIIVSLDIVEAVEHLFRRFPG